MTSTRSPRNSCTRVIAKRVSVPGATGKRRQELIPGGGVCSLAPAQSVVGLDDEPAVHAFHTLGLAGDCHGAVRLVLRVGGAAQPHHAVCVRIDPDPTETG